MNVLIATDGSCQALHAMREAAKLLPLKEAHVTVVSVAPLGTAVSMAGPYDGMATAAMPYVIEQIEREATRHLDEATRELAALGVTATSMERLGEPVEEILAAAHELRADLIVVGSHGYGTVKRVLLGSVSDGLAHRAPGSVLIVRPEPGTEG